jgi:hypothetical protein
MHGGSCQQLDVQVRGEWKACSLSMPAFTPNWTGVDEIAPNWPDVLPEVVVVTAAPSDPRHEGMTLPTNAN